MCPQIGDVGHPDLIGPGRFEALFQPVLGHDSGLAAISAGTAPVANLRSDPGQRRQPGNTVPGNPFALIAQIVGQLAIAVDLAAVSPGLPNELSLTYILLRTVT